MNTRVISHLLLATFLATFLTPAGHAQPTAPHPGPTDAAGEPSPATEIVVPALFANGMVLQRDLPIPVWGTAAPGQNVTVTLDKQWAIATADAAGKWMLRLKPVPAGGPYDVTVSGRNTITYTDVVIGDVWIASGQSNMAKPVRMAIDAENEIAKSTDPSLRMFAVKASANDEPQTKLTGSWSRAEPNATAGFSAVGCFFARELRKELNIPIGVIHSSRTSSPARAWTPREALTADPLLKPIVDSWEKVVADAPAATAKYEADSKVWQEGVNKAKAAGLPAPKKPAPPPNLKLSGRPSALYNGMIAPLVPYGIKGVIWYQGESDAGAAAQYKTLFPALISSWRKEWGQGDFPFHFVQLANYLPVQTHPSEGSMAFVREAQAGALSLPNTGMAVTTDIGDAGDLHPKNKQDVGKRLALSALAQVYGRKIPYSGPVLGSMRIEGATVKLRFMHADGGLKPRAGEDLKGFAVAGADRNFEWATAKIVGDTLELSSPVVTTPVAVRYNWASNPIGNLYNGAGLPAGPFRTDAWAPSESERRLNDEL